MSKLRFLKIDYKLSGFKPEDIVIFEESLLILESKYFSNLLERFPQIDITNLNVVLAQDIWEAINIFYKDHQQIFNKLRPKGLDHMVKGVSANDETKLFWSSKYVGEFGMNIFFQVLFENLIENEFERENKVKNEFNSNTTVRDNSDKFFKNWLLRIIVKKEATKLIPYQSINFEDMGNLTFAFKKNIKELHFQYQKNLDNYSFIIHVFLELEVFILRVLSYKTDKNFHGFEEFEHEVNEIIKLLDSAGSNLDSFEERLLIQNDLHIKNILKKCDVEIFNSPNHVNGIGFKISEGPKKLFPDLIDIHPRIIAFIDILGFKALINEYETEINSLVLKRLKTAFDLSRRAAFDLVLKSLPIEVRDQLEFKMFSDCITISIPYIDFGVDIKTSFQSMAIIVNVLQQTFMKEGFYLRGHITLGSYFSDQNMLFSGGLVEAYENEGKTIYPVISVNNKIIQKIRDKTEYDEYLISMKKLIIVHNLPASINHFINPFFTLDFIKSYESELDRIISGNIKEFDNSNIVQFSKLFQTSTVHLYLISEAEISEMKERLLTNYNNQIEIYTNFNYSHSDRTVASSIIEKYRFLNDFIKWFEDGIDERFRYLMLS